MWRCRTRLPSQVAIWLAATMLGATLVPSDPEAAPGRWPAACGRTRPAVGVGSVRRAGGVPGGRGRGHPGQPGPQVALVDEDDTVLSQIRPRAARPRRGSRRYQLQTRPTGWAIMFTSGTTSQPKGVVLTQANYAFTGDVMAAAAALGPGDRQLVPLPCSPRTRGSSFAAAISVSASVALMSRFSASRITTQVARHRPPTPACSRRPSG